MWCFFLQLTVDGFANDKMAAEVKVRHCKERSDELPLWQILCALDCKHCWKRHEFVLWTVALFCLLPSSQIALGYFIERCEIGIFRAMWFLFHYLHSFKLLANPAQFLAGILSLLKRQPLKIAVVKPVVVTTSVVSWDSSCHFLPPQTATTHLGLTALAPRGINTAGIG